MGLVVDRLLLWIYTSVCVAGALGILLNAPIIFDQQKPICVKGTDEHVPCIPAKGNYSVA